MTPKNPDAPLVDVLAAVFHLGNELQADADTLPILQIVRKLRPDSPTLAVLEAQQLLQTGDHGAARQLLEETDANTPDNALIKAMLALALLSQHDKLWRAYAEEARGLPSDPKAQSLLDALDRLARGESLVTKSKESETAQDGTPPTADSQLPRDYLGLAC
jgi:type III secretion protein HrpB1